jgi:hypothetical protein
MADLDQGGTFRIFGLGRLGPSIGFTPIPYRSIFPITAGGTYIIDPNTNTIQVNTLGAVTIVLPAAGGFPTPAIANPGLNVDSQIVIVDVGGNAQAHPITIQPTAGDTIMGLASIQITVNYGGYTLLPIPTARIWNSISP